MNDRTLNITPIGGSFGAIIDGLRLDRPAPGDALLLQQALLDYGVLVIRGQELTPAQHVAATRLFGEPETFHPGPGQIDGLPEVFRLASRSGEGYLDVGRYWHSDGSFRAVPTPISFWHTVETPAQGGATLFTDLRQVWRDLGDGMQRQLAGVETLHRNGVVHPLRMAHPVTGAHGLYLNVGLTSAVVGHTPDQARALVGLLDRQLSRPEVVYQHDWRPGDVVVADNLRVAHKATVVTAAVRRVLDRTTVAAGTAFKAYQAAHPAPQEQAALV